MQEKIQEKAKCESNNAMKILAVAHRMLLPTEGHLHWPTFNPRVQDSLLNHRIALVQKVTEAFVFNLPNFSALWILTYYLSHRIEWCSGVTQVRSGMQIPCLGKQLLISSVSSAIGSLLEGKKSSVDILKIKCSRFALFQISLSELLWYSESVQNNIKRTAKKHISTLN